MRTVVCGIAFKERFSIEGEGVFMRRLFSCCASLALAIGGFAGVGRAQFKKGGEAGGGRVAGDNQPAIWKEVQRGERDNLNHRRPVGGGSGIRGKVGAP